MGFRGRAIYGVPGAGFRLKCLGLGVEGFRESRVLEYRDKGFRVEGLRV